MEPSEALIHLREVAARAGLPARDIVLPTEHHAIANGTRIHYFDWGSAGKPTVVFLHGAGLNAHTWDPVCLMLRGDFHCVAVDLRGHGDSEWSPIADYGVPVNAVDIAGLVEAIGLDRFTLVGHSFGGMVSLSYAAAHPSRLHSLVIVDVGPEPRVTGAKRVVDFMLAPAELDSVDDFVDHAIAFNPGRRRETLVRSLKQNLRQTASGKWTWKYDRRHMEGVDVDNIGKRTAALWKVVGNITCPTLVVRGSRSDVFHDEDAERLARALPNGRWVKIENASHIVQSSQPKALVDEIRTFLGEVRK